MLSKRVLALIGLSIAMPLASLAAPAPLAFVPGQSHFAAPQADIAPLEMHPAREAIRSAYMVVLKPGVTSSAFLAHRERINSAHAAASAFHGERATDGLGHIYDMGAHFQGYAGRFTDDVLAYIRAQPEVEFVEVDTIVRTTELPQGDEMVWDIPYETSIEEAFAARDDRVAALETEKGAPWVSASGPGALGPFSDPAYNPVLTSLPCRHLIWITSRASLVSRTARHSDSAHLTSTSTTATAVRASLPTSSSEWFISRSPKFAA